MQGSKCPINSPLSIDPDQLPDFLNIAQLSVISGLSVVTIRNYVKKGAFPQPVKFTPKKIFWRKTDILQFFPLQEREIEND